MTASIGFDIYARDRASGTFRSVGNSADTTGNKLRSMGSKARIGFAALAAGAAVAGVAAGKFALSSISKASDLNETLSKSRVIFGQNADSMLTWAEGADRAAGLSTQAALDSAASFGDMFTQLGFTNGAAADMSKTVVQLSADLGSFNNLPTAEVLDMISGGFRGEYDALQRVIPNISAARVETQALAMTGKDAADSLTAQEKAAATLAIVQKDGARAQGDFARTSGGLANQQKILRAQFDNLSASVGQKLLPIATALTTWANDKGIPALTTLGRWVDSTLAPAMQRLGGQIRTNVLPALQQFAGWVRDKVIPVLVDFYKTRIRQMVEAFHEMKGTVNDNRDTLKTLGTWIRKTAEVALKVLGPALKTLSSGQLKGLVTALKITIATLGGTVRAVKLVISIVKAMGTAARAMASVVRTVASSVGRSWSAIKSGAQSVISTVASIPGRLRGMVDNWAGAGRALISAFVNGMKNASGIVTGIAGNVWSAVRATLNSAIGQLRSALNFTIGIPGPDIHVNVGSSIPYLAKGGIVTRPTLAVVGEAGPEAVVPLRGPHAPRGLGRGGDTYIINVHDAYDPKAVAERIDKMLTQRKRDTLGGRSLGFERVG